VSSRATKSSIPTSQGSTLMWTESYAEHHPAGTVQRLQEAAFWGALILLAAGSAGFFNMEGPASHFAWSQVLLG